MRRANAIVTILIFLLFVLHLIWGGLILTGLVKGGSNTFKLFSYAMMLLICIHVLIGIKLTLDSIRASKMAGVFYIKENSLFVLRRVSGFALLIFIAVHFVIFSGINDGSIYRLRVFDKMAFISQILMVLCLVIHLISNIKPLRMALGISDKRSVRTDIVITISILLFLAAIAFLIYFIRWQVV